MSTKPEPGVAAVNRAMSILKAFEDSVEGMSLTDLMNATGLYHSTILRLCESLEHANLLKRLDDGRYRLGPYALYLGMLYQGAFRLQDYAAPVLRELVKATEETGAIYIREGDDRICLHRMVHPRTVRMHVREGERVQLELGAAGKVLLAFGGGEFELHAFALRATPSRWASATPKVPQSPAQCSTSSRRSSAPCHWVCPAIASIRRPSTVACRPSCMRPAHSPTTWAAMPRSCNRRTPAAECPRHAVSSIGATRQPWGRQ